MSSLRCRQLKSDSKAHRMQHILNKWALSEATLHAREEHALKMQHLKQEHEAKLEEHQAKMQLLHLYMSVKRAKLQQLAKDGVELS